MKRFLHLFLLMPIGLWAQQPLGVDTTDATGTFGNQSLHEVTVTAPRTLQYSGDTKAQTISAQLISAHQGDNLGQLLQSQSALNIKAYGVGGALANLALRGSSTSHTQINWNGFPINSLTLGACDLSQVPVSGFDQVNIVYGASGTMYGSGTFGGAVNLDTDTRFANRTTANVNYGYNSLQTNQVGAAVKASSSSVSWSGNVWFQDSKNRFDYYDYIKESQRTQTNGAWNDRGTIQNLAVKTGNRSALDAGVWYQDKNYHIPSKIGSTTYEFQKDSALRLFARYKVSFDSSGLVMKAAAFYTHQYYWQKSSPTGPKSIESVIDGTLYAGDANYRQYFGPHWVADLGATYTYQMADVAAYQATKKEQTAAAIGAIKYSRNAIASTLTLRHEATKGYIPHTLWGLGATYSPKGSGWSVRGNVSSKYRNPTFNDRYWIPGGNADLKPESGITAEVGHHYKMTNQQGQPFLETDLTAYTSTINDMIVWRPGTGYWSAVNYQQVHSQGLEAEAKLSLQTNALQYRSMLNINLNHSVVNSTYDHNATLEGKTMSYSPRIITSWSHWIEYHGSGLEMWHKFTSDRFNTARELMDPFHLFGARAFTNQQMGTCKVNLSVTIDNLFDQTYELIELYPLPGRTYQLKINITI